MKFNKKILPLIALRYRLRAIQKAKADKRKHRYWVRPTLLTRNINSQLNGLLPAMQAHDREWYFR